MLETGTLYHQIVRCDEANQRNQTVIDALTPIYQTIVGANQGAPTPPLTEAESLKLVLDNRWYSAADYADPSVSSLPVPVRHLEELRRDYFENTYPGNLKERYEQEAGFFADLWKALFEPIPGSTWAGISVEGVQDPVPLRDVWVNGLYEPFYYDAGGQQVSIPMPAEAKLIDFHPQGSFGWIEDPNGDPRAFTECEQGELAAIMQLLRDWDGGSLEYRNDPDSKAAVVLSMYQLGLTAGQRRWVGLENGEVPVGSEELATCNSSTEPLTAGGDLPTLASGVLIPYLELYTKQSPYSFGAKALTPLDTLGSVLHGEWGADAEDDRGRYFDIELPYDALYTQEGVRQVLGESHVNDLVLFFLELGGYYDPAEQLNVNAKVEVWQNAGCKPSTPLGSSRGRRYRTGYPYTRALGEVHLLRRLLDTAAFLKDCGEPVAELPTFGNLFRVQVRDVTGQVVWPPQPTNPVNEWLETTAECTGGFLRSVRLYPKDLHEIDGFASEILCLGGSGQPLVTLFPYDEPGTSPRSFYWNVLGQKVMDGGFETASFVRHMEAYRNNELLDSHFSDYEQYAVSVTHQY